jgi:GNAT superfamily N-acetyltransferase
MTFEIREADLADRADVTQLVREMIPGVAADARLRWLYESNPAGRALTWIARARGEVAGCTSYFPFRLQLDGAPVLGALGGDGFVRPRFRRRGLGGLLHESARRDMTRAGIACMYGAPGAMNLTPLKHGGSREVGHVARWVRPLGGAALGLHPRVLDRAVREVLRPRFAPRLEPMRRADARVDDVWQAFAPTLRLGAVRDSTFYTWRFLDAPSGREPAFVIVDHGRPIGACALERMHGGHSMRIVDLIARPGTWHRCLAAIAKHAATTDAHHVDIKLMALDGRRRQMWRAGFVERETKPFLVVIPARDGDRRFVDPLRWFYGGADADVDVLD